MSSESWNKVLVQIAHELCMIRKTADDYEAKRICETEQKDNESKATDKDTESLQIIRRAVEFRFSLLYLSNCRRAD